MPEPSLPIDRGWAWVILTGTFLINMLQGGCIKSFGLLYAEFLSYFQTGAGETAWIFSVTIFILMCSGSLSSALGKRFGYRSVIMAGSVTMCLGYVTSAFVSDMRLLYLTYGIIVGLGAGLSFTPSVVMATMYFNKRRSLANGFTVAGSGVGYFLYPFLINYLIKSYSLFGTMIILGGVVLNSCIGAALLRPLESFKKGKDDNLMTKEGQIDEDYPMRQTHTVEESPGEIVKSASGKSEGTSCRNILHKGCYNLTKTCDWSYLRDPEFVFYVIAFCLASMGYCSGFVVVPPYAVDCGVNKDNVALLVSLAGLFELTGRIVIGCVSDLTFVRRKCVFVVVMLAGGGSALLAPLATSFLPLAIYTCWYGLFAGSYWALIAALLADSFGVEKVPQLFGLTATFISIPYLLSPPILGWMRDVTGSWSLSFRLAGISMILAGVTILLQPLATRLIRKRDVASQNTDTTGVTV